jgi:hypothetical protein
MHEVNIVDNSRADAASPAEPTALCPALNAWEKLADTKVETPDVNVLKRNADSLVLRLCAIGPDGSDVIAKKADKESLERQMIIQNAVLEFWPEFGHDLSDRPCLPRCYGLVDLDNERWLFEEDVGGMRLKKKGGPIVF